MRVTESGFRTRTFGRDREECAERQRGVSGVVPDNTLKTQEARQSRGGSPQLGGGRGPSLGKKRRGDR